MMTTTTPDLDTDLPPNHHAAYPALAGTAGLIAALSVAVGRREIADLAVRLAGVGPGDDVVDVGCGPGVAVRRAAAGGAASAVGVDPAPVMRRVARAFGRHRSVRYLDGTAEALPRPDGSASVVWSVATVHHWRDLDAGLTEARRVLRPAGRFLAMERRVAPGATGHGTHGWTAALAERFAQACAAAGFVDIAVSEHRASRRTVLAVLATSAAAVSADPPR